MHSSNRVGQALASIDRAQYQRDVASLVADRVVLLDALLGHREGMSLREQVFVDRLKEMSQAGDPLTGVVGGRISYISEDQARHLRRLHEFYVRDAAAARPREVFA